ncbi:Cell division protein FtsQ [Roseibacterium elongatum DSM 19469]|uniref:Cell division protein FtsQ n=1 Tax=Roseicyclus elongatus DSM 19469 TaxID=1294273 RepID=W8RWH8_9RHOB|nr:cell division protein FtsQ/DivIB [Roseibacterium elongatum]AHM05693.1 Cell division protein FtsQ [Roseibacterium elongatum DSM 19469]
MRPLMRRRTGVDPAPSIWTYRVQRLWLTPVFRRFLRIGVPAFAASFSVLWYFSDEAHVTALVEGVQEIRREIEDRPEFRVNLLGIEGASPRVTEDVRGALALDLPMSSFDIDLVTLRERVEALPAVAEADLRVQSGGVLSVTVSERVPALVWQTRDGVVLIDAEGHFVASIEDRVPDRPLPIVAGEGADMVVDEALALFATAEPLQSRLRGLVRVGLRRWDMVLEDGPRIQLPEVDARGALDRVLALDEVQDILSRDIERIDLRNPRRPTVQLSPNAMAGLLQMRDGIPNPQPLSGDQRG